MALRNDAALPADSLEDLILSMKIFEEFCNDMHLYIAITKTFLTIFHHETDAGVVYDDNSVWLDGTKTAKRSVPRRTSSTWAYG